MIGLRNNRVSYYVIIPNEIEDWFSQRCTRHIQSAAIVLISWIGYTSFSQYWIYFFDFIPMSNARAGGNAGFIRKLHSFPRRMFFLRIIARATKPISHSSPFFDHLILAFIFLLIAPSFRSSVFPGNPSFSSQVP